MLFPGEDGYFSVDVDIAVSPQFFGWLTGVGEGIQIVEPEDVKEGIQKVPGENPEGLRASGSAAGMK